MHPRITIETDKRDRKPCMRGMGITVNDVLGRLAQGMTEEEILDEQQGLEKDASLPLMLTLASLASLLSETNLCQLGRPSPDADPLV